MSYFTSVLMLLEAMQQQLVKPEFRTRLESLLVASIKKADFVLDKEQLLMLIEMLAHY